jgi:hypothetical protein
MDDFIKLPRKIFTGKAFKNKNAVPFKIWIWCLGKETHNKRKVRIVVGGRPTEVVLEKGQFIYGRNKASKELNMPASTIHYWINKFASSEYDYITKENHKAFSIITIWQYYEINFADS